MQRFAADGIWRVLYYEAHANGQHPLARKRGEGGFEYPLIYGGFYQFSCDNLMAIVRYVFVLHEGAELAP